MPWHIESDHSECSGFAVVKDADGSLVACHETEADAKKHMAALYANEPEARSQLFGADAFFAALAVVPNHRTATFDDLEIDRRNGGFRFHGHAAVFDEVASLDEVPGIGVVSEEIRRGSFRKVLQRPDNIPLLLEHDETKVLATTRSGRLRLQEDAKGLAVDAELPDTSLARDLHALVESDVISGMSFGFVTGPQNTKNWTIERRTNGIHRVISGFKKLLDVCATWDPAYPSAEAQFRSLAMKYADSPESFQQLLMGAYPQLGERDTTPEGTTEDAPPETPEGEPTLGEHAISGVTEHRSVAARRRDLQFLVLTTGGINDET